MLEDGSTPVDDRPYCGYAVSGGEPPGVKLEVGALIEDGSMLAAEEGFALRSPASKSPSADDLSPLVGANAWVLRTDFSLRAGKSLMVDAPEPVSPLL